MAEQTPNYNLTKPGLEEFYDVTVQNSNMDIIDTALKGLETNKASSTNLTELQQAFTEHSAENASETTKGHVELATSAETTAGTDNTRAVHPAGLKVALDKKVNKVQGSLISGTLLNGWQGSIRFVTNDLGVVTVDVDAYGGTVTKDTIICSLPSGYRPIRALILPALTDAGNIVNSAFYIDTGGNIKIGTGLTAGVYHFALATFMSI